MAKASSIAFLLQTASGWRFCHDDRVIDLPVDSATPTALARWITESEDEWKRILGKRDQLSVFCTSASIFWASVPSRASFTKETLLYDLELELPFSAEDMLVRWSQSDAFTYCVCTRKSDWQALTIALAKIPVRLYGITSSTLQIAESLNTKLPKNCWLVVRVSGTLESVLILQGQIRDWRLLSDSEPVPMQLSRLRELPELALDDQPLPEPEAFFEYSVGGESTESPGGQRIDATDGFPDVLRRTKRAPWHTFALETDATMQDRWSNGERFLGIALGCLVILLASFFARSIQIRRGISEMNAAQADLFQSAFPNQRVPGSILRRLRSEQAKQKGIRNQSLANERSPSSTDALYRVLKCVPKELSVQIEQCRLENGLLLLSGTFSKHTDAGRLAEALQAAGFDTGPPTTELLDSGKVKGSIRGTWTDTSLGELPQ